MDNLIEAKIIGDKYINSFRMNDGSLVTFESTKDWIDNMGKRGMPKPNIYAGDWEGSWGERRINTKSGELEEGYYYKDGMHYYALIDGLLVWGINLETLKIF